MACRGCRAAEKSARQGLPDAVNAMKGIAPRALLRLIQIGLDPV